MSLYLDPNSNRSPFEQAFMHAVRAIIACNDDLANGALNEARRHFVRDTSVQDAFNMDIKTLEGLYGDLHYEHKNAGPWIQCPKQMALIADTVTRLGDADDVVAFNEFAEKVGVTFKRPVGLVLAA